MYDFYRNKCQIFPRIQFRTVLNPTLFEILVIFHISLQMHVSNKYKF